MKKRIIELIQSAPKTDTVYGDIKLPYPIHTANLTADHLLANGVIAPPVKVGQMVYMPWEWKGQEGVACLTVRKIIINTIRHYVRTDFETDDEQYYEAYRYGEFDFEDFGVDVFLTREQAEKALAERKKV